jgi:drug/metabolite transporter (DMT)-like permease
MSSSNSTAATSGKAGLVLALISAASFSTAGSFARSLAGAGWSTGAAVTARVSVAAVVLAIPTILAMRGRWHVMWRNAGLLAIYGLVTVAGTQMFYFNAVAHLSVGVALLLEYLGIVLIVAWMWLRHGQRPRQLTLIGSLVAVLGLMLVIDVLGDNRLDVVGVIWALAGAVGLAVYFVLSARAVADLPPVAVASGGMLVGAATLIALGAVGVLPMHATFGTVALAGHQVSWWVPVAGLSLIAAAIAYVAGIGAARLLGPRLAGFVGLTEVVFAVLVAWLLLGELPTAVQLGGGVLILAGIALVRIDERSEEMGSGDPAGSAGGARGEARRGVDELRPVQKRADTIAPIALESTSGAAVTPRGAVT